MSADMFRSRIFGAVVAMVLITKGGSAVAGEAEDLIASGIKLRKQNRDQEALPLFQKALQLKVTPRALGQLGTCEQALGLWFSSEKHITEALKFPDDPWVHESWNALNSSLHFVEGRLGWIEVWGSPAGAAVLIDGERVATLPMAAPVRVPIGQRGLAVEAAGYFAENRTIEVHPGDSVREHVALRSSLVAAQGPPGPSIVPAGDSTAPSPLRVGSFEQRTWMTPVGVGLGVAGAALVTWGIVWIAIDGTTTGPQTGMTLTTRDTKAPGWALAGVGAVAVLGGGVLAFVDGRRTSSVAVGITPSGVRLGGTF